MKTNSVIRFPIFLLAAWGLSLGAAAQSLPTLVVQPKEVDLTFPADAVVEAVNQATVAAQVPGRIIEVRVDAGQAVKKGEVLMRIDAREAAEAVAAAEANAANARVNFERTKRLQEQKFLSQAAVDKARADYDSAHAVATAARVSQGHGVVTAPISGIVARRLAELGEMAAPGRPLVAIYQPGGLRAVASVPQQRLKDVRGETRAQVEFPELGKWVAAASVTLLPTADAATHVAEARVNLPAGFTEAMPGMAARVHFVVGHARKLTVPAQAVVRRGEVAAVYVVEAGKDGQQRIALRQLRLGDAVGSGEFEVLAGLSAGERVVLEPVKAGIALKQNK